MASTPTCVELRERDSAPVVSPTAGAGLRAGWEWRVALAAAVSSALVGIATLAIERISGGFGLLTAAVAAVGVPTMPVAVITYVLSMRYRRALWRAARRLTDARFEDRGLDAPPCGFGLDRLVALVWRRITTVRGEADALREKVSGEARARKRAQIRADRAQVVLNALPEALLLVDESDTIISCNRTAAELFGCELRDMPGLPLERLIADPKLDATLQSARSNDDDPTEHTLEIAWRSSGSILEATVRPIEFAVSRDDESHIGVLLIFRDVTHEREGIEAGTDFIAGVSHELRTPLASILAYTEMLLDGEAPDEASRMRFCRVIRNEADRLGKVIGNVVQINRIESGAARVQRDAFALAPLIQESIEMIRPQALAQGVSLRDLSAPLGVHVLGDEELVRQALVNLLANAIKYTPVEGPSRRAVVSVSLDVDEAARMAIVAVTDSGVGIPESEMPRLFEKFYRVNDHKKLASGSGLGLSLVRQVIETVHGGRLHVVSEPGKGSTFSFTLPLVDDDSAIRSDLQAVGAYI